MSKYIIEDLELGIEYQDSGPWRDYRLDSEGNNLEELENNAWIMEVDQDGGDLNHYEIGDAESSVYDAAIKAIKEVIK